MTTSTFAHRSPASEGMYSPVPKSRKFRAAAPTAGIYSFAVAEVPLTLLDARTVSARRLARKISTFATLEQGWDGYNGRAASFRAIHDARSFIDRMPLQSTLPNATLSGAGEITLYWDNGHNYLEASFPGNGTYHYFIDEGSEPQGAEDDLLVTNAPSEALRRFLMRYFA